MNTQPKGTAAYHAIRGVALSQAAARRELWRMFRSMPADQLTEERALFEYLTTSESAKRVRPSNIQRVDLWYLRLIRTEQRKRAEVKA